MENTKFMPVLVPGTANWLLLYCKVLVIMCGGEMVATTKRFWGIS